MHKNIVIGITCGIQSGFKISQINLMKNCDKRWCIVGLLLLLVWPQNDRG